MQCRRLTVYEAEVIKLGTFNENKNKYCILQGF